MGKVCSRVYSRVEGQVIQNALEHTLEYTSKWALIKYLLNFVFRRVHYFPAKSNFFILMPVRPVNLPLLLQMVKPKVDFLTRTWLTKGQQQGESMYNTRKVICPAPDSCSLKHTKSKGIYYLLGSPSEKKTKHTKKIHLG